MDEQIKYRILLTLVKKKSGYYNSATMLQKLTNLRIFFLFCVTIVLFTAPTILAHEGHHKQQSQSAPTGSSPGQIQTSPTDDEAENEQEKTLEAPRPAPLPFTGPVTDHLHNKIVHFPLALGIAGALFVFISLKRPEMLAAARILWLLAALIAVGAYFSGKAQEEPFEEGAMSNIFEAHENCGIASAISLWVGFLLTLTPRFKGLRVLSAIEVLLILSVTGYYGGLLAHS